MIAILCIFWESTTLQTSFPTAVPETSKIWLWFGRKKNHWSSGFNWAKTNLMTLSSENLTEFLQSQDPNWQRWQACQMNLIWELQFSCCALKLLCHGIYGIRYKKACPRTSVGPLYRGIGRAWCYLHYRGESLPSTSAFVGNARQHTARRDTLENRDPRCAKN